MTVQPIPNPLEGEHIAQLYPEISSALALPWRRRLNFLAGRSLSNTALNKEQDYRTNHLDALGQLLTAGVIKGLEVNCADSADGPQILINSGKGLTRKGEWAVVSQQWDVSLNNISGYDQVKEVGILMLEPRVGETLDNIDSTNPCEYDPQSYAFEDWQRVEGCIVKLYPWPEENSWTQLPRPDASGTEDAFQLALARWRNELAYEIFEQERVLDEGETLPWETHGLAIALIGFDKNK